MRKKKQKKKRKQQKLKKKMNNSSKNSQKTYSKKINPVKFLMKIQKIRKTPSGNGPSKLTTQKLTL